MSKRNAPDASASGRSPDESRPGDRREQAGGSGTAGPATREKHQAGSYARDAEQDPRHERHGRADADAPADR
jgi:ribosomal protein L15